MTTLFSAMWFDGRPVEGAPVCQLHGSFHQTTRGYSPISVCDRACRGYGPWLDANGVLIESNFQDWTESVKTPECVLDAEDGYAELWPTVQRMLELAQERRPDVRWGFYVGRSGRGMNADEKDLLADEDPAMIEAAKVAQFVVQCIYPFITDEPTMQMDGTYDWQRLGFYRHCVGYDLRRWAIRGVPVVPIVSGCYHAREGPEGVLEANRACSLHLMRVQLGFAARFPHAISWGGFRHGPEPGSLPWATHGQPWQYLAGPLTAPGSTA